MSSRLSAASAASLTLCAMLLGCDEGGKTPVGTSVESIPAYLGTIRDADGHAVEGAEIRIFPVDYLPRAGDALAKGAGDGTQAYRARTDAEGHYVLPAVTPGLYNLLAARDGETSLRDSIFLPARSDLADTLRASGSLSGRVEVQPTDDARGFAVQVVGLPYRAWLDAAGGFELKGLPAGQLRLRVAREGSTAYREGNLQVTVVQGREKTLEEPVALVYLNVPLVAGLTAEIDTAKGVVKLAWNRPASLLVDHYLIVRESGTDFFPSNWVPVEDTVFFDTLFRNGNVFPNPNQPPDVYTSFFDSTIHKVNYRLAAVGRDDMNGPFTEKVKLEAPAPWTVTTRFAFGDDSLRLAVLPAGVTGSLAVSFTNPTRLIRKLAWKGERGETLRMSEPGKRSGRDTLAFEAPAAGDSLYVHLEATDGSGTVWKDSLLVVGAPWKRLADRPLPAYGRAGRYPVDQPMAAVDGKIYSFGSRGEHSQTAGTVFDPATGEWSEIAEGPVLGKTTVLGDKVYMPGEGTLFAYSARQDRWDSVARFENGGPDFTPRSIETAGGNIVVGSDLGYSKIAVYDPGSGSVSYPSENTGYSFAMRFTTRHRIFAEYAYPGWSSFFNGLWSLDWRTNEVRQMAFNYPSLSGSHVEINGFHYFVNGGFGTTAFDEDRQTFETRVGPGFPLFNFNTTGQMDTAQVQAHAAGGRIFAMCMSRPGWIQVKTYTPGDRLWMDAPPMVVKGNRFASVVADGTLYVLSYYGKGDKRSDENPSFYAYPTQP